jgi:CPA2 family monovalent cation:H+ antiporter-2
MDNIVTIILICAGISLLLNVVLKKVQVESVIGYILTGVIVGIVLDLQHSDSLEAIAEFGIVFLMFTIGVEFSPEKLWLMKREVFLIGPLQIALTASIFLQSATGGWAWIHR